MRIIIFGTYDSSAHPRIASIAEGLAARGFDVAECNIPLGLDTAARVDMLARPWKAGALAARLASRWLATGADGPPDAHARRGRGRLPRPLRRASGAAALPPRPGPGRARPPGRAPARPRRTADWTAGLGRRRSGSSTRPRCAPPTSSLVDTEEHREPLPERYQPKAVVVPVGAPAPWHAAAARRVRRLGRVGGARAPTAASCLLRSVHPVAGHAGDRRGAWPASPGAGIEVTMIGRGQDEAATKRGRRRQPVGALA